MNPGAKIRIGDKVNPKYRNAEAVIQRNLGCGEPLFHVLAYVPAFDVELVLRSDEFEVISDASDKEES